MICRSPACVLSISITSTRYNITGRSVNDLESFNTRRQNLQMNHKNAMLYLKQTCSYCIVILSTFHLCYANQAGINPFLSSLECQDLSVETIEFRSFSIMDIPDVSMYVDHYGCNGESGTLTVYSNDGISLQNLEISLDGGMTFMPLLPDNFDNLLLLNVAAGEYEVHIRMAEDNDTNNQRYIGIIEVLIESEVDRDKDGFTKCEDINDNDPCLPADCDLTQGLACDLSIITKEYEWCHFENLYDSEQLSIDLKVNDIEGYASYQWSTGDTSSTTLVSPISDTYFHVSVSDQTGCVLNDSVLVKVLYIPHIDVHVNHQNCNGELGSIVLFSPVGEAIDHIEISLDSGDSFQPATYDNFGNIILFGLALGEYSISIRHAVNAQCIKDLGSFFVEDEQFFDEDEDGVLTCVDVDDTDECVPNVCENCKAVSAADFESDDGDWIINFDQVELSSDQSISGVRSVTLSNDNSLIESEALSVGDYKSIKISLAVFPDNLEINEALHLSMSSDGGNTYQVLTSWVSLIDFHNNDWFTLSHRANIGDDTDDLTFRLSLSASENNDYIYVDDIEVEFCKIEYMPSETIACDIINYDDVDAFLDFWQLGGKDALISTMHSTSGQFSYQIKNGNAQSSSIISSPFSTTGVGQLSINFNFTPISMELKEFFSLELSLDGGATYGRIRSWISGDVDNGRLYRESVDIPLNTSVNNMIVRFTNYGNSQYDHVYLDDIKIEYCEDITKRSEDQDSELIIVFEKEKTVEGDQQSNLTKDAGNSNVRQTVTLPKASIYPNPTANLLTIDISSLDNNLNQLSYRVMEVAGKTVILDQIKEFGKNTIDVSDLRAGLYMIQVFDQSTMYLNQKLIKI